MTLALIERKDASDGLSFEADAELAADRAGDAADLLNDFKAHMQHAARQFIERSDARLHDRLFDSFAKRSQECLQAVMLGRLNDAYDEIAGDYLLEDSL